MILSFTILFGTLTLLCLLSTRLRIPLMIAYIIGGLVLSNTGLDLFTEEDIEAIKSIQELGLVFVLFIVGLKLDITTIKSMGSAFIVGAIKIVVILVLGFGVSMAMHLDPVTSIFIGLGLSFSSTIVIVKLLSDKGEIDSYPGRIALGTLIVEDIASVIAIIVINLIASKDASLKQVINGMIFNIIILGLIVFVFSRFIIPKFIKFWAKNTELLTIISLGFSMLFAFICEEFGFSQEVGAFIGGMMFAPYKEFRDMIASRLAPLRDFCIIIIFVYFGILVDFKDFSSLIRKIAVLTFFSVTMKPMIAYALLKLFKYKSSTSLKTGLVLSQISEFSLIIAGIGIDKGIAQSSTMTMLGVTFMFSVLISTFLVNYSDPITNLLTTKLKFIDNKLQVDRSFESKNSVPQKIYKNIIFGYGDFGESLFGYVSGNNIPVLAIDADPIKVVEARKNDKNLIYGDVEDIEFLSTINFNDIKWVINTIPATDHKKMLKIIKKMGFKGYYGARSDREHSTKEDLQKAGVNIIFEPHINAAKEAYYMLLKQDEKIKSHKIEEEIKKLKNHYIICGYGRMGKQVAIDLQNEDIPIVVVDNNPEVKEDFLNSELLYIYGNASNDEVLKKAGIDNAKGLIAVYPTDESNVFIVLTAKNLNPNLDIVARSIAPKNEDKLRNAGANKVISPYLFGGRKIASAVTRPTVFEFNEKTYHGNSFDITFEELRLSDNSSFIDKTIAESNFRKIYGVTIVAVKRADGEFIPNPQHDLQFKKGDKLVVISNLEETDKLDDSPDFILVNGKNPEN